MKIARQYNIPFLATGKRHGFTTTWKNFHEGLAIDLGQLKTYEIDQEAGTITMGGAAGIGDFQDDLFEAGLMIRKLSKDHKPLPDLTKPKRADRAPAQDMLAWRSALVLGDIWAISVS